MAAKEADETASATTLRGLGFRGPSVESFAADVAFDSSDFALFQRYPEPVPWKPEYVGEDDQLAFKSVRSRLKSLAEHLVPAVSSLSGYPDMTAFASLYETSGRLPFPR